MLKIKLLLLLSSCLLVASYIICSEAEILAEKLKNARLKNDHLTMMGRNVGNAGLQAASQVVVNAGQQYTQEWVNRQFDGCPTVLDKIKRIHEVTGNLNAQGKLIQEQIEDQEKIAQKCLAKIKRDQASNKITAVQAAKQTQQIQDNLDNVIEEAYVSNNNLIKARNLLQAELDKLTLSKIITPSSDKQPVITNTKEDQSSLSNNQTTESKTDNTQEAQNKIQTTEEDNSTTQQDTKKGLIGRIGSFLVPPFAVTGINSIATACGAKAFAEWLAAKSPFFKGKEEAVAQALTCAGGTAVLVAVYKLYEAFTSDDDDEDEDIFSTAFATQKH